jgi:aspartate/methionine/tyrosine aminotransferase
MLFFFAHSGVTTVGVAVKSEEKKEGEEEEEADPLGPALIPSLEKAYQNAEIPIKALVLANPNNPLGRYYSREVLEECLKFCQRHNLHLISDEVLGLDTFPSPDLPNAPSFVSALSLDPLALGCDPDRVHVVWTTSKDLGVSGMRLVCRPREIDLYRIHLLYFSSPTPLSK